MKWIFFGEVLYNMFRIIMLILIDLFELVVFVINIWGILDRFVIMVLLVIFWLSMMVVGDFDFLNWGLVIILDRYIVWCDMFGSLSLI